MIYDSSHGGALHYSRLFTDTDQFICPWRSNGGGGGGGGGVDPFLLNPPSFSPQPERQFPVLPDEKRNFGL